MPTNREEGECSDSEDALSDVTSDSELSLSPPSPAKNRASKKKITLNDITSESDLSLSSPSPAKNRASKKKITLSDISSESDLSLSPPTPAKSLASKKKIALSDITSESDLSLSPPSPASNRASKKKIASRDFSSDFSLSPHSPARKRDWKKKCDDSFDIPLYSAIKHHELELVHQDDHFSRTSKRKCPKSWDIPLYSGIKQRKLELVHQDEHFSRHKLRSIKVRVEVNTSKRPKKVKERRNTHPHRSKKRNVSSSNERSHSPPVSSDRKHTERAKKRSKSENDPDQYRSPLWERLGLPARDTLNKSTNEKSGNTAKAKCPSTATRSTSLDFNLSEQNHNAPLSIELKRLRVESEVPCKPAGDGKKCPEGAVEKVQSQPVAEFGEPNDSALEPSPNDVTFFNSSMSISTDAEDEWLDILSDGENSTGNSVSTDTENHLLRDPEDVVVPLGDTQTLTSMLGGVSGEIGSISPKQDLNPASNFDDDSSQNNSDLVIDTDSESNVRCKNYDEQTAYPVCEREIIAPIGSTISGEFGESSSQSSKLLVTESGSDHSSRKSTLEMGNAPENNVTLTPVILEASLSSDSNRLIIDPDSSQNNDEKGDKIMTHPEEDHRSRKSGLEMDTASINEEITSHETTGTPAILEASSSPDSSRLIIDPDSSQNNDEKGDKIMTHPESDRSGRKSCLGMGNGPENKEKTPHATTGTPAVLEASSSPESTRLIIDPDSSRHEELLEMVTHPEEYHRSRKSGLEMDTASINEEMTSHEISGTPAASPNSSRLIIDSDSSRNEENLEMVPVPEEDPSCRKFFFETDTSHVNKEISGTPAASPEINRLIIDNDSAQNEEEDDMVEDPESDHSSQKSCLEMGDVPVNKEITEHEISGTPAASPDSNRLIIDTDSAQNQEEDEMVAHPEKDHSSRKSCLEMNNAPVNKEITAHEIIGTPAASPDSNRLIIDSDSSRNEENLEMVPVPEEDPSCRKFFFETDTSHVNKEISGTPAASPGINRLIIDTESAQNEEEDNVVLDPESDPTSRKSCLEMDNAPVNEEITAHEISGTPDSNRLIINTDSAQNCEEDEMVTSHETGGTPAASPSSSRLVIDSESQNEEELEMGTELDDVVLVYEKKADMPNNNHDARAVQDQYEVITIADSPPAINHESPEGVENFPIEPEPVSMDSYNATRNTEPVVTPVDASWSLATNNEFPSHFPIEPEAVSMDSSNLVDMPNVALLLEQPVESATGELYEVGENSNSFNSSNVDSPEGVSLEGGLMKFQAVLESALVKLFPESVKYLDERSSIEECVTETNQHRDMHPAVITKPNDSTDLEVPNNLFGVSATDFGEAVTEMGVSPISGPMDERTAQSSNTQNSAQPRQVSENLDFSDESAISVLEKGRCLDLGDENATQRRICHVKLHRLRYLTILRYSKLERVLNFKKTIRKARIALQKFKKKIDQPKSTYPGSALTDKKTIGDKEKRKALSKNNSSPCKKPAKKTDQEKSCQTTPSSSKRKKKDETIEKPLSSKNNSSELQKPETIKQLVVSIKRAEVEVAKKALFKVDKTKPTPATDHGKGKRSGSTTEHRERKVSISKAPASIKHPEKDSKNEKTTKPAESQKSAVVMTESPVHSERTRIKKKPSAEAISARRPSNPEPPKKQVVEPTTPFEAPRLLPGFKIPKKSEQGKRPPEAQQEPPVKKTKVDVVSSTEIKSPLETRPAAPPATVVRPVIDQLPVKKTKVDDVVSSTESPLETLPAAAPATVVRPVIDQLPSTPVKFSFGTPDKPAEVQQGTKEITLREESVENNADRPQVAVKPFSRVVDCKPANSQPSAIQQALMGIASEERRETSSNFSVVEDFSRDVAADNIWGPASESFHYVSRDYQENADNFDPAWEALKQMDQKNLQQTIHRRWGNVQVPNPGIDLTVRSRVKPVRRHHWHQNAQVVGPNKHCTYHYDTLISKANQDFSVQLARIHDRQAEEQANLSREASERLQLAIFRGENLARMELERINDMKDLFKRQKAENQDLQSAYDRKIAKLKKCRLEILSFYEFYQTVDPMNRELDGLTPEQERQIKETGEVLAAFERLERYKSK